MKTAKPPSTLMEYVAWIERDLAGRGVENARLEAELLVAEATGLERLQLYLQHDRPLEEEERRRLRALVIARRKREPIAYILGRREFYSIPLRVARGVLIPRPETEHVVDAALEHIYSREEPVVVDTGTGSGAILAALMAASGKHALWYGVDMSSEALEVAASNLPAGEGEARVLLVRADMLSAFRDESVDLLVSNPPYIPSREMDGLAPEVARWEPREALDGGETGVEATLRLLEASERKLRPGGTGIVETDPRHRPAVERYLAGTPRLRLLRWIEDLGGRDRVFVYRKEGGVEGRRFYIPQTAFPAPLVSRFKHIMRERGGIIGFPADTVWGLAVDGTEQEAVERLYELKGRDRSKPFPCFAADAEELARFGRDLPDAALNLARRWWPGPLTIVVKAKTTFPWPWLLSRDGKIGLRVPDMPWMRQLCGKVCRLVANTSANKAGREPVSSLEELECVFGERLDAVIVPQEETGGLVVPGGRESSREDRPSTVVSFEDDGRLVILREGAIPASEIRGGCAPAE